MPSPTRIVLLRDGSWPEMSGVCCWRRTTKAAFVATGAEVVEVTCWPARTGAPPVPAQRARAGRLPWLPSPARRSLAAAFRGSRAVASGLRRLPRQLSMARHHRSELAPALACASLVVAESLPAAMLAAESGASRHALWALALPDGRLFTGDGASYAAALSAVAPVVGGFLAGSEADRASVERATSARRVRVMLFPPVATDQPCPDCVGELPVPSAAGGEVGPLVRWRAVAGARTGGTAVAQRRAAEVLLAAAAPVPPVRPRPARSVLVAGYDLKFATELAAQLDRRTDLAVTLDDWPELGRGTPSTEHRLARADTVLAEWARTSAAWLSQRKRPGQFLAVRLHRFELDSPYPKDIAIDNVDAVVYIAPLFGRRIRDELGWPVEKLVYLPNYLDVDWLDRPKLPGARFTIGFVGIEWSRKRFDLALDLLVALRREDLRFTLAIRSVMPWRNPYVWRHAAERDFASRCFERIEQDPLLRGAVSFDPPGGDMARWYRRVGHLVSTSDAEGSHASVAEAMASGSVPVVRAWPGAAEVYDKEWVHASTEDAVAAVLASADTEVWADRAARAKDEIRRTHDPVAVVAAWADLLHGDLAAARAYFPEQATVTVAEERKEAYR